MEVKEALEITKTFIGDCNCESCKALRTLISAVESKPSVDCVEKVIIDFLTLDNPKIGGMPNPDTVNKLAVYIHAKITGGER